MYEKERFASLTTAIAALLAGLALFHFEFTALSFNFDATMRHC